MANLTQMYLGWRNRLYPPEELKEIIAITSIERLAICEECPLHSKHHNTPIRPDDHCTDCGCNLAAKTKCLSCECPKNKWGPLMTLKEEQEILNSLNDGKQKNSSVS